MGDEKSKDGFTIEPVIARKGREEKGEPFNLM